MMTLYEKIISLYPELTPSEDNVLNHPFGSYIELRNDADGRGDYIAKWEHPTLAQPTPEQLEEIE